MSLENTFNKVEKLPKEKKLEVITSKEAIVKDLESYFKKNKYKHRGGWFIDLGECKEYFDSYMDFLKSFELNPEIISEVNKKVSEPLGVVESFGVYLSALIQTSYNQGHNDFKFGEVQTDLFGAFLQGQPKNPIKIIAETIKGEWSPVHPETSLKSFVYAKNCSITTETLEGYNSLWCAENCSLTAGTLKGDDNLEYAQRCFLIAKNIEGNWNLKYAYNCLVEIQNYEGTNFGAFIKDCVIKSRNKETLETIKNQANRQDSINKRSNKFELTK